MSTLSLIFLISDVTSYLTHLCHLLYHPSGNGYKRNSLFTSKTTSVSNENYKKIVTGLINSKNIWSNKDYNGYKFSLLVGNDT